MEPQVFFGMHMASGPAQYGDEDDPKRIGIFDRVLHLLNRTFRKKPVFVDHVSEVNSTTLKGAVGTVKRSFFNPADGKHWAEFTITSPRGLSAIQAGYRLSNAYLVKKFGPGGQWHAINYQREVLDAEYEHLALVRCPRYEESVIFTPEEFDQYNARCKREAIDNAHPSVGLIRSFLRTDGTTLLCNEKPRDVLGYVLSNESTLSPPQSYEEFVLTKQVGLEIGKATYGASGKTVSSQTSLGTQRYSGKNQKEVSEGTGLGRDRYGKKQ